MPEWTPEEELLLSYMDFYGTSPDEPVGATNFRELRLTGWSERDERNLNSNNWREYISQFTPGILSYWQAAAVMTFALRRELAEDELDVITLWWDAFKEGDYYMYYDGDKIYGHAIHLDPSKAIDDTPTILRVSGNLNSQGQLQLPTVELEITKPREIPQFPQWDDKIINRFHRSTDPEMQEYTKAIGDWSALMHNAISQLA